MRRIYFIYITILIMSTTLLFNAPSYLFSSNCLRCAENTLSTNLPIEFSSQTKKYETTQKAITPKLIIILASLGRSGSTMIAEVMATKDKSVLFFEPDHRNEHSACARVSECMSEYLFNVMLCSYEDNFEEWLKTKYVFLRYFHPSVKLCDKNRLCERKINLRSLCQSSEYKMTKLIRVRLGFLESLLKDESIDLKIVYLVRDPRATANSIKRLNWEDSPNVICPMVYNDLLAFDYLNAKYPQKLLKIQYEHFSLDPFNQTTILFNFAFGDKILTEAAVNYLETHTKAEEDGPMNTVRDSKNHYQKWRWEIKEATLKRLEEEPFCKKVLEKIKYKMFSNLTTARDKNISMFIT